MKNSLRVAKPVVKAVVAPVAQVAPVLDVKSGLFKRYLELKQKEEEVKNELDEIKKGFEANSMNGFELDGRVLKLQERNTISYSNDLKKYLDFKGVLDKCTTIDKKSVEALLKVNMLDASEVEKFQMTSKTTAWTVK